MPLITDRTPNSWQDLEELVTAFLCECGMDARRQVTLELPRGAVDVDVIAEEAVDGIVHQTICECKNWETNIPRAVVHAFRTVMQETGAHRGYIVSRVGFQTGAIEAAEATNIELVTFEQFQEIYFDKWFKKRIWAVEEEVGGFPTYYEPLGKPGYGKLESDEERAAYDAVWEKYLFAGLMRLPFSPHIRMFREYPYPELPFDISKMAEEGVVVPDDIATASGYREFLDLLVGYCKKGLIELRQVNPLTRDQRPEDVDRDD